MGAIHLPRSVTFDKAIRFERGRTDLTFVPVGFGTPTDEAYTTRRVDNMLHCELHFRVGVLTATSAAIDLPSGFTINDSESDPQGLTDRSPLGEWTASTGSASLTDIYNGTGQSGYVFYDGSDTDTVFMAHRTSNQSYEKRDANVFVGTNAAVSLIFKFPVLEWSNA